MTNSEVAGTRSENITRAEASDRSDLISATSYEVVLGPDFDRPNLHYHHHRGVCVHDPRREYLD